MAININENKPATKNQISNEKPNIEKSIDNILTGYIANSFNGGIIKPIAFKQIMAGERIKEYKIKMNIKMLTPKTPTYQNLKMTVQTFFVPNSRIWENAEAYTAQKGGDTVTKISEIPNLENKFIKAYPLKNTDTNIYATTIQYTTAWRDSYVSTYIPKIGAQARSMADLFVLPKISVLPLRGFKAIYNDFLRNKEYDEELQEYKNDVVSDEEWHTYEPNPAQDNFNLNKTILRGKRENSYYTDYRTEIQGFEENAPNLQNITNDLITWASWEAKIAEARSQAENAQLNDWDIIAKIRGSKKLTEGKVQLIGKKTFNLNYAAVTQNTYNNNEQIEDSFRVLGQQGAYSYTEIEIPCIAGHEFNEEGYIHIITQVTADSVFEKGIDRLELNVTPLEQYRPDLKDVKNDVLYECEMGTLGDDANFKKVRGFKRKYSEYFKLPNIIRGDLGNDSIFQADLNLDQLQYKDDGEPITIIPNSTFQFFEEDDNYLRQNITPGTITINYTPKNPWQDYTDVLINKNLAIIQKMYQHNNTKHILIEGLNQIFFIGKCICINDMPIDNSIKTNYTKWGEH